MKGKDLDTLIYWIHTESSDVHAYAQTILKNPGNNSVDSIVLSALVVSLCGGVLGLEGPWVFTILQTI